MIKLKKIAILIFVIMFSGSSFSQEITKLVSDQLIKKDNIFQGRFPINTENGKWVFSQKPNWFSGFTAGELWYMYELTGNLELKKRALIHSDNLIQYAELDNTHDLGFIFLNSCVKAYRHTGESKYRNAALKAARTLARRFNEKLNFIRAWGKMGTADREGLMIIDTMMNLELLFWAAKESGDYSLHEIAYKHAIICMNEHIRQDYSSFHVVNINPATGEVIKKHTHQGIADSSTWARGQAWGIYGFAITYKYTGDKRFLYTSKKMSEYFISHLPADSIPTWDLDLKNEDTFKDASAAAIAASGMFLLADLSIERNDVVRFQSQALFLIKLLKEKYLFNKSIRKDEEGILLHTVYNKPKNWGVNESYPAGDFFFIECLWKENEINKKNNFIEESETRKSYSLNEEWYYLEDPIQEIGELNKSSVPWIKINLPHTWNKTDALDSEPGYRRNISWYQKEIHIPAGAVNKNIVLHFEGVNNKAHVFINGKFAGKHIGGYVGFDIDITSYIKQGNNLLQIKVDNSFDQNLIPSQKSDFLLYGGISRNVWLNIFPKNYIQQVLIQTPKVSEKRASTKLNISFHQMITDENSISVKVKDRKGKVVSEINKKALPKNVNDFKVELPDIKLPILWSPDNPYLYTLEVALESNGKSLDEITEKVGYRWYEFKDHEAFYLNGKRLLLRGTHRHEELGGYGNALPDSLHRKDIKMIKEMGANFVRLAHYPQAKEVYRACDEIGLLVWDENPWCRGGMGTELWQANTKRLFKEMIFQNYNHPSIIIWSIGNECDWLPDFEGGDNPDSLKMFAKILHDLAKELDPYRLTATRKFPQAEKIVDVYSPSIWSGWYSDIYKNYQPALDKAREKYTKLFHAEYGGDSHIGRHTETPIDGIGKIAATGGDEPVNKVRVSSIANVGDWSESYIVDLFDWYLHVTENLDWFSGSAQWIFRDFTTPLRPENPIPYVNQKGLVDMSNNPKDAYYVFKSYWTQFPKFCYTESHTWKNRYGKADEKKQINVFSNCDEVELFLNEVSLGKLKRDIKKYPASGLNWLAQFNAGNNILVSVGYESNGKVAADTLIINYSIQPFGKPDNFLLEKERLADGSYLIKASAVDKNGNYCPDYNERIYFSALSGGTLFENTGIPTGSSTIEMANGKAEIIFKHIPLQKGVIEVRSQEFKGTYLFIH